MLSSTFFIPQGGDRGFIPRLLFLLVDVEIFELVGALRVGNNSEPVTEVVSLKVFLGQIFQISLGEVDVRRNVDLGLSRANVDVFAKVSSLSLDLDFGLEEFLEFSDDHDTVFDWVGAIDGESLHDLLSFLA